MVDEREVAEATELALLMPLLNADDSWSGCEVGVSANCRVCGVNCAFRAASALASVSICSRGIPSRFSALDRASAINSFDVSCDDVLPADDCRDID